MPGPPLPVFVLNFHQDYRCRQSGACCSAGWDIAVDPDVHSRLAAAFHAGTLKAPQAAAGSRLTPPGAPPFVRDLEPPAGSAGVLARTTSGDCVFFDRPGGNLCAIQRRFGHRWLPSACRHFPRMALLEDAGTCVALSHFCPTAAAMLFREDERGIEVVVNPPAFVDRGQDEGFDARGTVPPFLKPGVVFDQESRSTWNRFVMSACGQDGWTPGQALACLARGAEQLRAWTPADGPMAAFAEDGLGRLLGEPGARTAADLVRVDELFAMVTASVPPGLPRPALPEPGDPAVALAVARGWATLARPIRCYLAARAFGAWSAYQGHGVRTEVAVLAAALAVLFVESRRVAGPAGALGPELLHEAIRAADLLTVHLSVSADVVRVLSPLEHVSTNSFTGSLGVMAE